MRTNDSGKIAIPEVTLRIPGAWLEPAELMERLPEGCTCTDDTLVLADGTKFEWNALPADEDFPKVFAGSCSKLPTDKERKQIENYQVNFCLTAAGGSIEAAKQLMAGAAAILEAGGAGVFVDNSGIAHGATDWFTLFNSADNGGVYWAFISTVQSEDEIHSIGMHILGFRDAAIPATGDQDYDYRTLHSFLGYTAFSGVTLEDGEVIGDAVLPTFRVQSRPQARFSAELPMFNPYGEWRLEPVDVQQN